MPDTKEKWPPFLGAAILILRSADYLLKLRRPVSALPSLRGPLPVLGLAKLRWLLVERLPVLLPPGAARRFSPGFQPPGLRVFERGAEADGVRLGS